MDAEMTSLSSLEEKLNERLRETWNEFASSLVVNFEPANSIKALEIFGENELVHFKRFGEIHVKKTQFHYTSELEDGMNSPGILWDRLTILNCKYIFTSQTSVHHKAAIHKNLGNVTDELKSVMRALAESKPARNILLAKESTDRQKNIVPLEESLWLLQMSNVAMWINQDLLYTVSADNVDPQRLRDYIKFFSKANKVRNTAIEHVEIYYSTKMQRSELK